MAGTAAVAAKKALFDLLAGQAGAGEPLAGVQVSYQFPRQLERDHVYFGRVRFDHDYSTFRVAGGRQPRTEIATVSLYVGAKRIDSDQHAADTRAVEIGGVLEDLIAADPTLGGAFQVVFVESGELEPNLDDDGVWAILTYSVTVQSELS
ncbi:hypothetical protein SAMN04489727_1725 [Amycolatopsis tolypomycina]|uniref:Tail terminator n=1 Tax=Amycolatopsis tolypomycina TaxID=208445 RepID=A0A1H4JBJ7_9PSEU|nr:hypothetical protein [Amycolatopsis tolypomycina]SEB43571.1 hypothetical protein SAMN04489727_1725 [Amycolatopsis tolypomycina]